MKKSEHAAQLAEAMAEVERLNAIVPEPDELATVLPKRVMLGHWYWFFDGRGVVQTATEAGSISDASRHAFGNYFYSRDQDIRYAEALSTLLLMRRQPGQVDPSLEAHEYIMVGGEYVWVSEVRGPYNSFLHFMMFPAFAPGYAQAAVDAIGTERIVRTAKWLAGVMG